MGAPNESTQEPTDVEELSTEAQPSSASGKRRWIWPAVFVIFAVILTTVSIVLMRSGRDTSAGENESIARSSGDHSSGSEATLYLPGRTSIMVAVDEKSLDELVSAISTRGDNVQTLIQAGRVFTVPNQTRVRIVETSFAKMRVRILEGEKIMQEVWVPERWVR